MAQISLRYRPDEDDDDDDYHNINNNDNCTIVLRGRRVGLTDCRSGEGGGGILEVY